MRGERLAGFIYGTIVVLSAVIAGAKAFPGGMGHVAALVLVTAAVFYLAHVYAHALGHSAQTGQHLSFSAVKHIAWQEASLIAAAVPPVLMLVLGEIGVLSPKASVWAAIGVGLAVLALQGVVFARIERLGVLRTALVVALNLSLGVVLILLKVLVTSHHG
ncbi:MAG TPA: hypothetical protein VMB53_08115 [Gaiellaceae bacterium]|nr:hypothetical protein [Gaiellaceae bacterium]